MKKLISYLLSATFVILIGCTAICSSIDSEHELKHNIAHNHQSESEEQKKAPCLSCEDEHKVVCHEEIKLNVASRNDIVEIRQKINSKINTVLSQKLYIVTQSSISKNYPHFISYAQNSPLREIQTEILLF